MINPFTLKSRGFFEKLTRPATEEERIGERNNAILGYTILLTLLGLVGVGLWSVGKFLVSLI
jgi:hypothetical protein